MLFSLKKIELPPIVVVIFGVGHQGEDGGRAPDPPPVSCTTF